MKINIYYNDNGISMLDLITNDFMFFLQKYIEKIQEES